MLMGPTPEHAVLTVPAHEHDMLMGPAREETMLMGPDHEHTYETVLEGRFQSHIISIFSSTVIRASKTMMLH